MHNPTGLDGTVTRIHKPPWPDGPTIAVRLDNAWKILTYESKLTPITREDECRRQGIAA